MQRIRLGRTGSVRPRRSRRVLAATLVGAVSVVALTVSATVAGATPWSPQRSSTTWSQTRWVAPGDSGAVTVQVGALPKNTSKATFRVVVRRAADPTRVAVCAGATVTAACKNAAPTPARYTAFTTTVDLTGADRQVTLHSTASSARVTVSLVGYTTSSPTPSSPSQSAGEPVATTSETPSISETSVTAAPTTAVPGGSVPTTGWPGASNTGVPAGTALQPLDPGGPAPAGTRWSGDVLWVTAAGTVLDSYDIRGLVRVEAKDVVIQNCRITGQYLSSSFALVYVNGDGFSVTVRDSELYAKYPSPYVRGVIGYNFTLERVNVHDVIDQMAITGNNVVVKDSWLHRTLYYENDPVYNGTPSHDDNAQIQQGSNLTFTHNTMEGTHNAAIQVTQDFGRVSNLLVENNLISNGACSINLAQKDKGALQGITLRGNRFTRTSTYSCAIIVSGASRNNLSLSDNRWVNWNGSEWVADQSGTVAVQTN